MTRPVSRWVVLLLIASPLLALLADASDAATPAKLQPRAPQPSRRMGKRKVAKAEVMAKKDYSSFLCPGGSVACPVYTGEEVTPASISALESSLDSLADWFKVGFECMELETELNSCGGCLALGAG